MNLLHLFSSEILLTGNHQKFINNVCLIINLSSFYITYKNYISHYTFQICFSIAKITNDNEILFSIEKILTLHVSVRLIYNVGIFVNKTLSKANYDDHLHHQLLLYTDVLESERVNTGLLKTQFILT